LPEFIDILNKKWYDNETIQEVNLLNISLNNILEISKYHSTTTPKYIYASGKQPKLFDKGKNSKSFKKIKALDILRILITQKNAIVKLDQNQAIELRKYILHIKSKKKHGFLVNFLSRAQSMFSLKGFYTSSELVDKIEKIIPVDKPLTNTQTSASTKAQPAVVQPAVQKTRNYCDTVDINFLESLLDDCSKKALDDLEIKLLIGNCFDYTGLVQDLKIFSNSLTDGNPVDPITGKPLDSELGMLRTEVLMRKLYETIKCTSIPDYDRQTAIQESQVCLVEFEKFFVALSEKIIGSPNHVYDKIVALHTWIKTEPSYDKLFPASLPLDERDNYLALTRLKYLANNLTTLHFKGFFS